MVKIATGLTLSTFAAYTSYVSKENAPYVYNHWTHQAKVIEILRDHGKASSARTLEENLREELTNYDNSGWRCIDSSKVEGLKLRLDHNGV